MEGGSAWSLALTGAVMAQTVVFKVEGSTTSPFDGYSDVLQVLLDVPQRPGAGLQLGHLIIRQGHVDHAGHAPTVQHTGETQVHFVTDSIHALCDINNKNMPTGNKLLCKSHN